MYIVHATGTGRVLSVFQYATNFLSLVSGISARAGPASAQPALNYDYKSTSKCDHQAHRLPPSAPSMYEYRRTLTVCVR